MGLGVASSLAGAVGAAARAIHAKPGLEPVAAEEFWTTVNGFLSMPERIALGGRPAGAASHG
jgi:hypothetical protein